MGTELRCTVCQGPLIVSEESSGHELVCPQCQQSSEGPGSTEHPRSPDLRARDDSDKAVRAAPKRFPSSRELRPLPRRRHHPERRPPERAAATTRSHVAGPEPREQNRSD